MASYHRCSAERKFARDVVSRGAEAFPKTAGVSCLQASAEQQTSPSYSAGPGGIYGILARKLEAFEAELRGSQKSGGTSVADHEALAAVLSAVKEKLDEGESEASAIQRGDSSDAEEDLALTRDHLTAGIRYMRRLLSQCNVPDTELVRRRRDTCR